jgi:hypothetical protein
MATPVQISTSVRSFRMPARLGRLVVRIMLVLTLVLVTMVGLAMVTLAPIFPNARLVRTTAMHMPCAPTYRVLSRVLVIPAIVAMALSGAAQIIMNVSPELIIAQRRDRRVPTHKVHSHAAAFEVLSAMESYVLIWTSVHGIFTTVGRLPVLTRSVHFSVHAIWDTPAME